jgi:hypothetical protein
MGGDKPKEVMERRSLDRVMDDSILLSEWIQHFGSLPFSEIQKSMMSAPVGFPSLRTAVELDATF